MPNPYRRDSGHYTTPAGDSGSPKTHAKAARQTIIANKLSEDANSDASHRAAADAHKLAMELHKTAGNNGTAHFHEHKMKWHESQMTQLALSFDTPLVVAAADPAWKLSKSTIGKGGTPVYRYRKRILRTGNFVKEDDKIQFEITPAFLDHTVHTFNEMKKNGVDVPIPLGHTFDADKNKGFVRKLERNGDGLDMVCDLYGDDAPRLAATNNVSVYIPPKYTDGAGNVYSRPIVHVALTPYPVVPGLGDFQAVAASLVKEKRKMDWTKIKVALGITEEMTDDNAPDLVAKAFEKVKTDAAAAAKPVAASKDPVKISPMLLSLATDNRRMKLEQLVLSKNITPAVRDALLGLYGDEKALTLALSNESGDNFDKVVEALGKNVASPDTKPKTGEQTLSLAKPIPDTGDEEESLDDEKNPLMKDARARKAAALAEKAKK